MSMNRLFIKGGYGEHGRSCFLLPFRKDRLLMLDCGIMDTDPAPFPDVEPDLLKRTDYLFLSHCHKDHSGAFDHFRELGFSGQLIAARPTLEFSGIRYAKTVLLDCPPGEPPRTPVKLDSELSFFYGRSGHCVGSVWLHLSGSFGSLLYSGDYQKRALVYETDPIEGRTADLAILDCAHVGQNGNADELRGLLTERIREALSKGHRILMPLPKYGRGPEVLCMLLAALPDAKIAIDPGMKRLMERTLAFPGWLKPEAVHTIRAFLQKNPPDGLQGENYDVLLIGDTHLERPENSRLALSETAKGAIVLLTGRVKKGCCPERLLREGKAFTMTYPHHQSYGDFEETVSQNAFGAVLPFHNPQKEILLTYRFPSFKLF